MFFQIFTANNNVISNIIYSFFNEEDLQNFNYSSYSFIIIVENTYVWLYGIVLNKDEAVIGLI